MNNLMNPSLSKTFKLPEPIFNYLSSKYTYPGLVWCLIRLSKDPSWFSRGLPFTRDLILANSTNLPITWNSKSILEHIILETGIRVTYSHKELKKPKNSYSINRNTYLLIKKTILPVEIEELVSSIDLDNYAGPLVYTDGNVVK